MQCVYTHCEKKQLAYIVCPMSLRCRIAVYKAAAVNSANTIGKNGFTLETEGRGGTYFEGDGRKRMRHEGKGGTE